MRSLFVLLFALASVALVGCGSTPDAEERPTKRLANPGEELDVKPWNRGTRSSHYGTPFGLPTSN